MNLDFLSSISVKNVCATLLSGTTICGISCVSGTKIIENGTCLASTYLGISATATCASTAGNALALCGCTPACFLGVNATAVCATCAIGAKNLCGCVPASFLLSGGTAVCATCAGNATTVAGCTPSCFLGVNATAVCATCAISAKALCGCVPASFLLSGGTAVCATTAGNALAFCGCVPSCFLGATATACCAVTAGNALCLGGNLANTYAPLASPAFTTCITAPIACVSSCIRSPLISGGTTCGLTAVCGGILCGSTCVASPVLYGSTCSNSPLHCGACTLATTCVCSPVVLGSTCICSPITCGSTCVIGAIVCASTCFVGSGAGLTGTASSLTAGCATKAICGDNPFIINGVVGCADVILCLNPYGAGYVSKIVDYATASGQTLAFYQNNNLGLAIDNTGKIGIGTYTPANQLSVYNASAPQILSYGWSFDGRVCADSGAIRLGNNASYYGLISYSSANNTTFTIDNEFDNAGAVTQFRMRTLGTPVTAMTILGSGNVGIGVAVPNAKLDLRTVLAGTGITKIAQYTLPYATANEIPLIAATNDSNTTLAGIAFPLSDSGNAGDIAFYTYSGSLTEKLRIAGNGNVGIGIASPNEKLVVSDCKCDDVAVYFINACSLGYGAKIRGGAGSRYALNITDYADNRIHTFYGDGTTYLGGLTDSAGGYITSINCGGGAGLLYMPCGFYAAATLNYLYGNTYLNCTIQDNVTAKFCIDATNGAACFAGNVSVGTNILMKTGAARCIDWNAASTGVGSALLINGNTGLSCTGSNACAGGSVCIRGGCGGVATTSGTGGAGGTLWLCGGVGGSGTPTGTGGAICMVVDTCSAIVALPSSCVTLYYCGNSRLCTVTNGICIGSNCGFGTDWVATSDKRLKTDIQPISSALSMICHLCGICYHSCDDEKCENRIGLIAQDVLKIIPEIVSHSQPNEEDMKYGITDEKLGLKYDKLTAVLVEAIKEQQKQINCLCYELNYIRNSNT
jgi:hypothetical protein